jgi:periplasmic copper chaperone A
MRRTRTVAVTMLALVVLASPALAHVTIQPTEAPAGEFFRFVVRVPNERDDAGTVSVEVDLPDNLTFVSFQPKEGWKRSVTMKTLEEPIEVFGEPVTEVVDTVTWEATGRPIRPGEFDEFGFSARSPEEQEELVFPSIQAYSSGETVRWIGPAESEEPAPRVALVAAEEDEAATGGGAGDGTEVQGAQVEDGSPLSVMDWIALAVSLAALALAGAAFARRRTA